MNSGRDGDPEGEDWRRLLTAGERARMLDDIARVSLAVGRRLFPDRPWADLDVTAGSLASRKSPMERLWFIAGLLPDLTRTAHQIAQTPLTEAVGVSRTVSPPARARRVGSQAVLAAVRRGHAERHWEERASARSADTPENRAVKAFLVALRQDAAAIGAIAAAADEPEVCREANTAAVRLRGLAALPPWADVADDAGAWRLPTTHRMLADARYARIAVAMRHYRRSFQFEWANPLFSLPPRETWRLYEAWGLFQVLDALLALGHAPEAGAGAAPGALFAVHQDRLAFALVKGVEARVTLAAPDGRRLALSYNRSYSGPARSLSRTMQPDIAIERGDRTLVLDPKFKSYAEPGAEGVDTDQMHAYRDAIIGPHGSRVVARAWCLFCGEENGVRPLIAYGPPAASVVGALRLRPGGTEDFARLCHLLAGWLSG